MNKILHGNCLDIIKTITEVDCCVTSPPYWGLRDYQSPPTEWPEFEFSILNMPHKIEKWTGCYGLEPTPLMYVGHTVMIFNEVKAKLKKEGTLWLNIGDSYANNGTGGNGATGGRDKSTLQSQMPPIGTTPVKKKVPAGLKPKDLVGIPWMVAFALRDAGWYLRQDIIWSKPNPMPESVTDRCTKAHEYIFLFSKSKQYYYDHEAIKQPIKDYSVARLSQDIENQAGSDRVPGKTNGNMKAVRAHGIVRDRSLDYNSKEKQLRTNSKRGSHSKESELELPDAKANKRSVWEVATQPFKGAHFATFPQDLIVDCIKAGCPEGGTVLDPFGGSGTTAVVSGKLNRNSIIIDINPEYIKMSEKRTYDELGMFK